MTPSARVQAAIDILAGLQTERLPADRLIAGYFRARRYAGSRDRAAVAETVYAVLRRYATLTWRLGGLSTPRALLLAHLALTEGLDLPAIDRLLDGGRYAPAPLDGDERRLLAGLAAPPAEAAPAKAPPDWVRSNYPEWLEGPLRRRFGDRLLAETAALDQRAPLDLRVNRLKTTREAVLRRLAADGIDARPGRYAPLAVRLDAGAPMTRHPLFREGHVEVQDEGSQLASLLVDAEPGQRVLDLCAGAGGKTLALAAAMAGRGRLYASDAEPERLARMGPRLARAGVANVEIRPPEGLDGPDGLCGLDRVLVDAPCSGSGTWRRDPAAKWRLTREELAGYRSAQAALLDRGAALLGPGGRLVYVTCSVLPEENEDQVAAFLDRRRDLGLLPVGAVWPRTVGGAAPAAGPCLALSPGQHGTDGFFVAIFQGPG